MKTKTVKIADLSTNLFVRWQLNQDHAIHLGELLAEGVKLPPIEITKDNMVIDGRHRIEAHDLNRHDTIEATVVDVSGETELISRAYRANLGGALPPTPQDTEHTIALLVERGEKVQRIAKLLGLPPGMIRRYVNDVRSKLTRSKVLRAASSVAEGGLTVAKAAEQYDVDPKKLREVLSGRRRTHKAGIQDMQRRFTTTYKSVGSRNASSLRRLIELFEDGDVSERQVRDIFAHVVQLQKQSAKAVSERKKRFEATVAEASPKAA